MENDSNLTELFPADAKYWRDIEIISEWEAVLLSLGIEPRTIRDLACQRDPDDENDVISYGQQQYEYGKRKAALSNAIKANSLRFVDSNDPRYSEHINLIAFIAWAKGKRWSLPKWLSAMETTKPLPEVVDENQPGNNSETTTTVVKHEPRYMTMIEVEEFTGFSRSSINDAIKAGNFPSNLHPFNNRAVRFDRAEIIAHMEKSSNTEASGKVNKSGKK